MFMRFRGGGIGHLVTREYNRRLQHERHSTNKSTLNRIDQQRAGEDPDLGDEAIDITGEDGGVEGDDIIEREDEGAGEGDGRRGEGVRTRALGALTMRRPTLGRSRVLGGASATGDAHKSTLMLNAVPSLGV